jgi:putative acetyltransferase
MKLADRTEENHPARSAISTNSAAQDFDLRPAESLEEMVSIRELFLEYANSLGFSLSFQGFDHELASLPGDYAQPRGRLLLARHEGMAAGCVALHPLEDGICEMKRLYVRPQFRGRGLGKRLAELIIREARVLGYRQLRLDTVEPTMREAVAMYRKMGFREVAAYRPNPIEGALYMELTL